MGMRDEDWTPPDPIADILAERQREAYDMLERGDIPRGEEQ